MRRLLFVIIFFAMLFCSQQVEANVKGVKFVQVSDVHYVPNREDANEQIDALTNELNNIKDLDFVIFTGDNIDSPESTYLHELLKRLKYIQAPCYYVLGNHDVATSSLNKDKYLDIIRYHNWFSPAWRSNYTFKKNGIVFVVVDGAKEIIPGPNGYYKKDTLEWLDKVLTKNRNKPVVIVQHFPVVEPKKTRSHSTYKAEEYLAILDKYENVVAVVSGHYHVNKEVMRNGVYHVSTPSFAEEPHYYKLIEIVNSKNFLPMIFTQLRETEL